MGGGWELRQYTPVVPDAIREEMGQRTDWGDLLSEPPPETSTTSSPGER
jgi:hypothetical protein